MPISIISNDYVIYFFLPNTRFKKWARDQCLHVVVGTFISSKDSISDFGVMTNIRLIQSSINYLVSFDKRDAYLTNHSLAKRLLPDCIFQLILTDTI